MTGTSGPVPSSPGSYKEPTVRCKAAVHRNKYQTPAEAPSTRYHAAEAPGTRYHARKQPGAGYKPPLALLSLLL